MMRELTILLQASNGWRTYASVWMWIGTVLVHDRARVSVAILRKRYVIKTRYKIVEKNAGSTFSAPNFGLLVNFEFIRSKKIIYVFSFFFFRWVQKGMEAAKYGMQWITLSINYVAYLVGECDFKRFFLENDWNLVKYGIIHIGIQFGRSSGFFNCWHWSVAWQLYSSFFPKERLHWRVESREDVRIEKFKETYFIQTWQTHVSSHVWELVPKCNSSHVNHLATAIFHLSINSSE